MLPSNVKMMENSGAQLDLLPETITEITLLLRVFLSVRVYMFAPTTQVRLR